ncbi:hypothetical protein LZ30DRAFT_700659 [Colletotrichum cereale]|nr:hypothetical protein LZ30DRAFT_700659 [Colletotrichum cereale]
MKMRLFNTQSRELESFNFPPPFPYAILSHVYSSPGHDEWPPYGSAELQEPSHHNIIDKTCLLALQNGLRFVWIDSICIDKRSSAEVSETINSLRKYFQAAALCLAYLFDLPCETARPREETWKQSLFWSRAWTLQEILLSPRIDFYDSQWHLRGDSSSDTLSALLSRIMGVDTDVIAKKNTVDNTSIARRMAWAVRRRASHEEDLSYALLGIFDIHMSIIYGEGKEVAFRRLQEGILKTTNDMTLFAWTSSDDTLPRGIFARDVEEFECFGRSELASAPFHLNGFAALTNRGVLIQGKFSKRDQNVFLDLGMRREKPSNTKRCGILIRRRLTGTYSRVSSNTSQMALEDEPTTVMRVIIEPGDIKAVRKSNDRGPVPAGCCLASQQKALIDKVQPSMNNTILEDNFSAEYKHPTFCNSPHTQTPTSGLTLVRDDDLDWVHIEKPSTCLDHDSPQLKPHQDTTEATSRQTAEDPCCHNRDTRVPSSWGSSPRASDDGAAENDHSFTKMATTTLADRYSPNNNSETHGPILVKRLAQQVLQNFRNAQHVVTHKTERQKLRGTRATLGSRKRKRNATHREATFSRSTKFACPFFVEKPLEHLACLRNNDLSTMSEVRDHLWSSHRLPYHCPVCIQQRTCRHFTQWFSKQRSTPCWMEYCKTSV